MNRKSIFQIEEFNHLIGMIDQIRFSFWMTYPGCGRLFFNAAGVLFFNALLTFGVICQESEEIIRIDTDLIAFEVSIADREGNPVRGLQVEDFKLSVDGVYKPIDFFTPIRKRDQNRPLSVVFALDVSGSITGEELTNLRSAMQKFIARLADYDSHFAVITFGMNVKVLRNFTNDPGRLYKTFDKIARERDGLSTHAYDAVDHAIRLIERKSPKSIGRKIPKRVVIVITDGYPVGDTVSPATVIERANNAETSVYALILPSYSRLSVGNKPVLTLLEASGLTEKTGGRSYYATQKNFDPMFTVLADEITASYALAFYPNDETRIAEKFYKVKIETRRDFQVTQNRTGYRILKNR